MRVLITGASGFVGAALRRRLAADPRWTVRASSRNPPSGSEAGVEWMTSSELGPTANWEPLLQDIDVVVHLAARVHVMNAAGASDEPYQRVNVEGTRRLAEQSAASGVKRLVFLSSVKAHGEDGHLTEESAMAPLDAYGISKRDAEAALREVATRTNLEVVIIRSPLVHGPGVKANFQSLATAVRKGTPLPFASVTNRRSLVGVDNLADLLAVCMEHPAAASQAFFVSDDEDVSTAELVRRLAAAAGRPARLLPVPVWILRAAAVMTGKLPAVNRLTGSLTVDISKAKQLLAWTPPVTLDEGLRRAVDQL